MADVFEELEREEALKHRQNILGAKSRRDIQKENERYQKARIRIGEMHTAQTLGADWRTNPETLRGIQARVQKARDEQKARSDASVAKAREDMASGKTSTLVGKQSFDPNKSTQIFKSMVQGDPTQDRVFDTKEEAESYLKQTGQKGAVAGIRLSGTPGEIESAANKYRARAEEGRNAMVEEKERPEKERKRVDAAIDRAWATRYERASQQYGREMDPKKRYANELAERGLRNPMEAATPQERRQIEEENSRERMGDFRFAIGAKERAARAERQLVSQYRDFKEAAKQARKEKRFADAAVDERKAFELNEKVGGNIQSVTNRRKILEQNEMDIVREELQKRANLRIKAREKQTTANPEAASYDREDFTPKSTAAPIGVGTESLEYGQRPSRADATQQPFGMVPPQTVDRGVDFGNLSEANIPQEKPRPKTPTKPTKPTKVTTDDGSAILPPEYASPFTRDVSRASAAFREYMESKRPTKKSTRQKAREKSRKTNK
jgi:hypothetical protein